MNYKIILEYEEGIKFNYHRVVHIKKELTFKNDLKNNFVIKMNQ